VRDASHSTVRAIRASTERSESRSAFFVGASLLVRTPGKNSSKIYFLAPDVIHQAPN
jgi:hypothetical protein